MTTARRFVLTFTAPALLALTLAACATGARSGSGGAGATTEAVAEADAALSRSAARSVARVSALDAPVAAVLDALGDEVKAFHAHVTTLSNPYFGGRVPGEPGIEAAADYIEHYFREFGLEPPFEEVVRTADGSTVVEGSYRQPFTVPGETVVQTARLSWRSAEASGDLRPEVDFDAAPFTGSGEGRGPVVFVGYGIESGPDGYTSFEGDPDLEGAIALVLRFEPMDGAGRSQWAEGDGWSGRAGLTPKFRALTDRGVAGVVIVTPDVADDPRAGEIMSVRGTRFGGRGETPVASMSPDAARAMLAAAGASFDDLKAAADRGPHGAIPIDGLSADLAVEVEREEIRTANVGGVLPGRGDLADEYIVIGAHYDHVGMGQFGSRSPGSLHPGADDNASGTSGVLLAAELLTTAYADLPEGADARSVLFLTFSAEEMGLLGSRHFVDEPPFSLSRVVAMINMDMIGRLRGGSLEALGVGTGAEFADLLGPHIRASGLDVSLSEQPGGRSDHASFSGAGVPAIAFFTGLHEDYHAPGDVGSKIHHKGAVRVVDLVAGFVFDLATRPDRVTFVEPERPRARAPRMRLSVRLGIAPGNYADDQPGVLVGGVTDGTSAAEAGLTAGDRILRWNGEELLGVEGLMTQLAAAKPGDIARLVVLRDGREIEVRVTLKAAGGAD
ncbi:MAG: M28 family peptidase [Planctomycetota bacterium]|nr:MAG: M28 family peptidase [Planctomycetota bacterium]